MKIMNRAVRLLHWLNEQKTWLLPVVSLILMIVVALGVGAIVTRNHESQLEACERGNETRPLELLNLRTDREVLRDDIHKLAAQVRLLVDIPGPTSPAALRYIGVAEGDKETKQHAIDVKTATIKRKIESIEDLHVPGDPERVNCEVAYP